MTQTMGRTTKRVTQATHKALKSGASMTKPLRMLVTISVAFSMSKADLVFPVIHEYRLSPTMHPLGKCRRPRRH